MTSSNRPYTEWIEFASTCMSKIVSCSPIAAIVTCSEASPNRISLWKDKAVNQKHGACNRLGQILRHRFVTESPGLRQAPV